MRGRLADLGRLKVVSLPQGEVLRRVHDGRFDSDGFNPCRGAPTRFAPLRDAKGACIATLYAAESWDAAVAETILHDVYIDDPFAQVRAEVIEDRVLSELRLLRPLRLGCLYRLEMAAMGLDHADYFGLSRAVYDRCGALARDIHGAHAGLDGIVWMSRRDDTARACLLFGDRCGAGALEPVRRLEVAAAPEAKEIIQGAFERAGVTLLR